MIKLNETTRPKRRKADRILVLVVENNADQWLIIRSVFAKCFPEVEPIWVNNAAQAVTYLEQASLSKHKLPWLILLELYVPRSEDGWALIEFLKAQPGYQHIPLIILSHSGEQKDIARSYTFAIASYIVKPTTYHKWMRCIYSFRSYWWETVSSMTPSALAERIKAEPLPSAGSL